jgi:hypothetical protein
MNSRLTSQLSHFGLDPRDWIIEIKSVLGHRSHIEVHSAHSELRLTGWAEHHRLMNLSLCEF